MQNLVNIVALQKTYISRRIFNITKFQVKIFDICTTFLITFFLFFFFLNGKIYLKSNLYSRQTETGKTETAEQRRHI